MARTLSEELTNYEAWQIEKYGDVVPGIESTPDGELLNSGIEELHRLAEWISLHSQYEEKPGETRPLTGGRKQMRKKTTRHKGLFTVLQKAAELKKRRTHVP